MVPEERTVEGWWQIESQEGDEHFGTLTISSKTLQLVLNIPQKLAFDQTIFQSSNLPMLPTTLVGRTAHNEPLTLFGCGASSESLSAGLRTLHINAIAGIEGLALSSWDEPGIRAVQIEIDPLSIWLGRHAVSWIKGASGKTESCTLSTPTDLSFKLSQNAEFGIWCSTGLTSGQAEVSFRQQSYAWLQFDEPQSLKSICEQWVPSMDRLFSLLIGSPVRHGTVTCHQEKYYGPDSKPLGAKGKLIRHGGQSPTRADEITWPQMITRFSELAPEFHTIVCKWMEIAQRYEPLVDIFGMSVFNRSLHAEAQFLFFVQALEVYHARSAAFDSMAVPNDAHKARVQRAVGAVPTDLQAWVDRTLQNANYKYLDERLTELFGHYAKECRQIFGDDATLPERIRNTRNYLTHHPKKRASAKLLSDDELVRVAWNLRTFIWVCLLKELGISGAPVERLIRKYDVHIVNLK